MKEKLSTRLQGLISRARELGTFSSSDLGSGYDEDIHSEQYKDLMNVIGKNFPIPVVEQVVKTLRAELASVKVEIKDALFEEGFNSIKLDDGTEVTTAQEMSIKVENKIAMNNWLESVGYGAIVKTSFEFPKGMDLTVIESKIQEMGIPYDKSTDVHHQSLKKAMKEIQEKGVDFPESDIATITVFDVAVIKKPKAR